MVERNITTQGSIKFKQYIEDLLRNKHFMNTAKKLMATYNSKIPSNDDTYKEVEVLIKEYKKLDIKSKKWLKKNYAELDRLSSVMAEEYGLDSELLRPVLISLTTMKEGEFKQSLLYDILLSDLCLCIDNNDELLNPVFPKIPLALDPRRQDHLKTFPVSIDIHKFATKRDILDFIEKKWPWIEERLGQYRDYKNIKFRKRKSDRKIIDFIWDNRKLPAKKLKVLLDKEFPKNGLVYYEFSKIISQEKRRRNRKIIVGQ